MTIGLPTPPAPSASAPSSGRWLLAIVLAVLVGGGAAVAWWLTNKGPAPASTPAAVATTDTSARAPANTRVIVRVINGSGVRGLARRATSYLRDFGYDVVDYDSERDGKRATTQIVVHTGHRDWASRIQRVLGAGTLEERPDSLRYVDLTVILGRDWQPPAEALRP